MIVENRLKCEEPGAANTSAVQWIGQAFCSGNDVNGSGSGSGDDARGVTTTTGGGGGGCGGVCCVSATGSVREKGVLLIRGHPMNKT